MSETQREPGGTTAPPVVDAQETVRRINTMANAVLDQIQALVSTRLAAFEDVVAREGLGGSDPSSILAVYDQKVYEAAAGAQIAQAVKDHLVRRTGEGAWSPAHLMAHLTQTVIRQLSRPMYVSPGAQNLGVEAVRYRYITAAWQEYLAILGDGRKRGFTASPAQDMIIGALMKRQPKSAGASDSEMAEFGRYVTEVMTLLSEDVFR